MDTIITEQLFEAYLKCPMKCYRKYRNESENTITYASWSRNREKAYFDNYIKRVTREELPGEFVIGASSLPRHKSPKWRFIIDLSAQTKNLESRLQVVERIHSVTSRRGDELIPTRFSSLNKITKDNRLSVAFDSQVLSKMTGQRVRGSVCCYQSEGRGFVCSG